MKIAPKEINNFIANGFRQFTATLIYGNDYGSVVEKSEQIYRNFCTEAFDPDFNLVNLDFKDANSNPEIIINEIKGIAFNGQNKFIKLSHAGPSINKELIDAIKDNQDNIVIITTEELSPSSSLRKTFETEKNFACLACYHDDKVVIRSLISKKFQEYNLSFSPQILDYLVMKLGNDHRIAINEIEKIALYFYDKKNIDINELINFYTESNSELSTDNFISFFVQNKLNSAIMELSRLYDSDKNFVFIIRQLTNFFQKIKLIKAWMERGKNEYEAFAQIKPPIFFKNVPYHKMACHKLSMRQVDYLIEQLIELEINIKTAYEATSLLMEKFIVDNSRFFAS